MGFEIIEHVLKLCAGVVRIYQLLPTWIHCSALSSIVTEESNIFIPAAVLIASVISYITPVSNGRAVQGKQNKVGRAETTGAGSCVPDVKSYAAILFVCLHACGLLSNSYISEFSYLNDWTLGSLLYWMLIKKERGYIDDCLVILILALGLEYPSAGLISKRDHLCILFILFLLPHHIGYLRQSYLFMQKLVVCALKALGLSNQALKCLSECLHGYVQSVVEGQVVCFLLSTSGILYLRRALQTGSKIPQVYCHFTVTCTLTHSDIDDFLCLKIGGFLVVR